MAEITQGRVQLVRETVRAFKASPLCNSGLVWSFFLFSRLLLLYGNFILFPKGGDGDIPIYARYARAYETAWLSGGSVYDECKPEYPYFTLVVTALPRIFMAVDPAEDSGKAPGLAQYRVWYRLEMALFDLLAFLTMLWLVKKLFPDESAWDRTKRLLAFVGGGILLGTLLYTRLDIVLGTLILVSLALLVSRFHYAWSFAVLALAINYKLVPVILIPVWVVASLKPQLVGGIWDKGGIKRLLAACCWRSVVVVAMTVALYLPVYLSSGERSLGFFAYHKDRGLEINSVYSSVLVALRPFGYPSELNNTYGSTNVDSSASPILARLSPYITVSLLLAATFYSCRLLLRRKYEESRQPMTAGSAAPQSARDLVACASLVLLVFIAGNKVFSPQYLLWLVPLIPLLALPRWPRRLCAVTFALACGLSTNIMLVWSRHIAWDETLTRVGGPTGLGISFLAARNLVFLGLVMLLGVWLIKMAHARPKIAGVLSVDFAHTE